jgi:hypothetical protein
MTAKSDLYLKRAEEFEALARVANNLGVKAAYEGLAKNYRQLAAYLEGPSSDKTPSSKKTP